MRISFLLRGLMRLVGDANETQLTPQTVFYNPDFLCVDHGFVMFGATHLLKYFPISSFFCLGLESTYVDTASRRILEVSVDSVLLVK